jgi:CRP/FNR family transcriptional regulator, anaerobic regulatory protein
MQQLKQYFEKIGFAGDDLDKILQSFVLKSYDKNDFFVEVGKTNKYLGFIESGMMRYYVIKEGEERTTYVALERSFLVSFCNLLFYRLKPASALPLPAT